MDGEILTIWIVIECFMWKGNIKNFLRENKKVCPERSLRLTPDVQGWAHSATHGSIMPFACHSQNSLHCFLRPLGSAI